MSTDSTSVTVNAQRAADLIQVLANSIKPGTGVVATACTVGHLVRPGRTPLVVRLEVMTEEEAEDTDVDVEPVGLNEFVTTTPT